MDEQELISPHNRRRCELPPDHQDYVRTLKRTRDRRRRMKTLRFRLLEMEAQQNHDLLRAEMLAHVLKEQGVIVQPGRFAPETPIDPVPENSPIDGFDLFMPNEKPLPQVG